MQSPERFITVFSQEGRLWQVEYAFKVVKQSDITAIGVKTPDGIVVAVQKKIHDKLIDSSSYTHMFRITEHVGACLVGLFTDVLYISRRLRHQAANFQRKNGFEVPVSVLASYLSSLHQLESQYQSIRPTAVSAILFGFEPATAAFLLYKVDPGGLSSGYRAVCAGGKEAEAQAVLEKGPKEFGGVQEASEFVLGVLRTVVGIEDFQANEIEVAIVTRENAAFRLLSEEDVGGIRKAIAGKD
jgi:20S proteasome subunit alpha 1